MSRLGFDFSIGLPVAFGEWFSKWMCDAPDKLAIMESISILWTIWCCRNNVVFRNFQTDAMQAWRDAQHLCQTICRSQQRNAMMPYGSDAAEGGTRAGTKKNMVVLVKEDSEHGRRECKKIVVDGAWRKASWEGATAWVNVDNGCDKYACRVNANSAVMVEALAVLHALEGARSRGWRNVEILTDCLLVIKGLTCVNVADIFVKPVLLDIWYVSKFFSFVSVSKVARQSVGAAHALAKRCIG